MLLLVSFIFCTIKLLNLLVCIPIVDKIMLNEIKPIKNSKNLMVITYPYCLLNINNLEEYNFH